MRTPARERSPVTRWRISSVSVAPMSNVTGASSSAATAQRPICESAETSDHPRPSRAYDEREAESAPSRGRIAASTTPSTPTITSTAP